MTRTIAIGDIHGCAGALSAVLRAIQPEPSDLIITLGDYIDRGPDSRDVIEQLLKLQQQCETVHLLGNHETIMLSTRDNPANVTFWNACGGANTLRSYGADISDVPDTHWAFIESCKLWHEIDGFFFVHANYDPTLPLDQQHDSILLWTHLTERGIPAPHVNGKTAIVGHTPQPNGQVLDCGHLRCIDTYCYGTGCLTALEVTTGEVWQADKNGNLLDGD